MHTPCLCHTARGHSPRRHLTLDTANQSFSRTNNPVFLCSSHNLPSSDLPSTTALVSQVLVVRACSLTVAGGRALYGPGFGARAATSDFRITRRRGLTDPMSLCLSWPWCSGISNEPLRLMPATISISTEDRSVPTRLAALTNTTVSFLTFSAGARIATTTVEVAPTAATSAQLHCSKRISSRSAPTLRSVS